MNRPILLFSLFFFAFYYLTFFPGILREDSSDQLGQALRHEINDWHSPVMTLIWSWLNRIYVGPAGILLLSDLFFFSGLAIILDRSFFSLRKQLNVLLLVTLFPINFCLIGDVTKTSFFCSTLLLATALAALNNLVFKNRIPRLLCGSTAFLLLALSMAIRPDGIAATFPILGWLVWCTARSFFPSGRSTQILVPLLLSLVALFGLHFLIGKIDREICQGRQTHPEQVFLASDLAALSLEKRALVVPPSILNPGVDLNQLRATYYPSATSMLYWGRTAPFHRTESESDFNSLRSEWKDQVLHHPFLYLKERTVASYYFLGPAGSPYAAPTFSVVDNTWGYFPSFASVHADFHPGYLSSLEVLLYFYSRNWFFERPWFFFLLSLLNVGYLLKKKEFHPWRDQVSLLLALSGLAHLALLFLFTPEADYRYSGWLILSSSLSGLLSLVGAWPSRTASRID